MAQTMMLMSSVAGHGLNLKKVPSIHSLKPKPFSHFLLPPSSQRNNLSTPSTTLTTIALFKAKTKAPAKKAPPPKPKVEDGIFGTSGGIGFTKENELFVGRVAMLGFAVSQLHILILSNVHCRKCHDVYSEFRDQASLLGEGITGKGILSQLNIETGIPIYEAEPLLLFFILFTLLGAIGALGDRGRFVDDATGLEKAVIAPGKGFRSAIGLPEGGPLFGFTKANELFVGRLAQLGFAFSLIGEVITGKGALAQLNIETGLPINELEPLVLFNVLFFFVAALNPGTGKFVTDEDED